MGGVHATSVVAQHRFPAVSSPPAMYLRYFPGLPEVPRGYILNTSTLPSRAVEDYFVLTVFSISELPRQKVPPIPCPPPTKFADTRQT